MPQITTRAVSVGELLDVMYPLDTYAFESSPPLPDKTEWLGGTEELSTATIVATFADGKPVASALGWWMTQQVRGALFPMAGLAGIATALPERRKGYTRRTIGYLLAQMREEGKIFSCLYPFRESFYERLGYIGFPQARLVKFTPAVLLPLLKQAIDGDYEQLLILDGYQVFRSQMRQLRQQIHGLAIFDGDRKITQNTTWLLLAKVAGEIAGLMLYNLKGDLPQEFKLNIYRFYYHTHQGRYLLLQWIAHHTDQANAVEMRLPAFEQPETWLADLNIQSETLHWPRTPMGRVLEVAKIGGMTTGAGHFTARIVDPLCPWNEGNWNFETMDGVLRVETAKQADCEINIQALSSLVYGTLDPADWVFRGWGNPSPELQAVLRSMFPPKVPYLHESF